MKVTKEYFDAYRLANGLIAAHRDGSRCGICGLDASESDHVFGRGTRYNLLNEHWLLRMSVCRSCHHKKHGGSGFDRPAQVRTLKVSNTDFVTWPERENVFSIIHADIRKYIIEGESHALEYIEDWLVKNA